MAAEAPDPRNFKTWEDAFQYPIPVVRKLEQQLRSSADENREKLRSLVGTSYRNLLDTAETIVDMEVRMAQVESKLAKVGQNCNTGILERITKNVVKMNAETEVERFVFASQLAVLRNCPVVMTRLIKGNGSSLLIAKVLVISRLLHKGLSQLKDKPPIVDKLWEQLLSVRRKLLRRIDKRLSSATGDNATLVESMCAYALATSSTPTDVLYHFHKTRMDKVVNLLQRGHDELAKHGTSALKLCIQTCQDTQAIFPRRLAESLAKLKSQPLVKDADVWSLFELNLDIHERWIGDEPRNYTPWPRHDELQRAEAERILHQWSKQAISTFLKGIKAALEKEERLQEVASLRQDLIEIWILSGSRMSGVKSANVLDDLRDTMNHQLENIVRSRTEGLKSVVSKLSTTLDSASAIQSSNLSLWGTFPKSADLSNGAHLFKSSVLNMYQGRDNSVIDIVSTFDTWMETVLQVKNIVKAMKEARWEDTFADDVEDLDDDDFGESRQTLLVQDDPQLLEEVTQEALGNALHNLGSSFQQVVEKLAADEESQELQRVCFVLRVIREIGERIPKLKLHDKSTPSTTPFTSELLRPLHTVLATRIVQSPTKAYQKSITSSTKAKSRSYILWEGSPALPAQPSPATFAYLQRLTKTMASYGADLWTPACVSILKSVAREQAVQVFKEDLATIVKLGEGHVKPVEVDGEQSQLEGDDVEGDKEPEKDEAESSSPAAMAELRDLKLKQAFFDMLYVQRLVGTVGQDADIDDLLNGIVGRRALDETSASRLRKSATEYAKKTYLLFALLA